MAYPGTYRRLPRLMMPNTSSMLFSEKVRAIKENHDRLYKEQKMKKPIFENEEESEQFIKEVIPVHLVKTSEEELYMQYIRENLKEKGYIKKSIVDEADEMYSKYNPNNDKWDNDHVLIELQNSAIQYLQTQLKNIKEAK